MFKVPPASLQTFIDRLTLTPSVIPNSNYVIIVSDWNCLKYFYVFLYCNHQVHRDFLITLYIMIKEAWINCSVYWERYGLEDRGIGSRFLEIVQTPDRLRNLPNPLPNWIQGYFPWEQSHYIVTLYFKFPAHPHGVLSLNVTTNTAVLFPPHKDLPFYLFKTLYTRFTYLIWTFFSVVYSVFFIVLWHCTTLCYYFSSVYCTVHCSCIVLCLFVMYVMLP
jgi:hypothetical protein